MNYWIKVRSHFSESAFQSRLEQIDMDGKLYWKYSEEKTRSRIWRNILIRDDNDDDWTELRKDDCEKYSDMFRTCSSACPKTKWQGEVDREKLPWHWPLEEVDRKKLTGRGWKHMRVRTIKIRRTQCTEGDRINLPCGFQLIRRIWFYDFQAHWRLGYRHLNFSLVDVA